MTEITDLKTGDMVVARTKGVYPGSWEEFKERSEYLQVAIVVEIHPIHSPREIRVKTRSCGTSFLFLEEDLTKVE